MVRMLVSGLDATSMDQSAVHFLSGFTAFRVAVHLNDLRSHLYCGKKISQKNCSFPLRRLYYN